MHPAHSLLLLNLKSPSWSQGSSSHQSWRWQDIAAALGMGQLPPLAEQLARAKYCEDDHCRQQLLHSVLLLTQRQARSQKWRCRGDLLERLAMLAVYETLSASLCHPCSGRGRLATGAVCPTCRGHGRQPLTAAQRYRFAGVDKRNWQRRWHPRYEDIYRRLSEAEQQLFSHMSWQLKG